MCRQCGREACSDCFQIVKDVTAQQNGDSATRRQVQMRHDFLTCLRRGEHSASSFCPVTRFTRKELEDAVKEMKKVLSLSPEHQHPSTSSQHNTSGIQPLADDVLSASSEDGQIPSHVTSRFTDSEFTEDTFRSLWIHGAPIIVDGLLSKFEIPWTPQYFIETSPNESCVIVECQSNQTDRTSVSDFFGKFGQYDNRIGCWKLKVPTLTFRSILSVVYDG
jgi:[histone H3]-dimethyl-L-lysine9 demethylase